MGSGVSGAASAITIQFDGTQPFMAGHHVTGIVVFRNTPEKSVRLQHIYAELLGEVVHTTKQYNGSGYCNITHREAFFRRPVNLEEKQGGFTLEDDYYSWPISFLLPTFLPPSLNQLSTHGPFVRYKIRVVFERPEKYKMNIHRSFPIHVIACSPSRPYSSFLPVEVENKNRSDVTLHAVLADQNGPVVPGDGFLLDIELHNPNHLTIKCLSVDLVQNRTIWMGGHCALTIPLLDLPHLREFSGEHYHETLKLTIPADGRVMPTFHYIPSTSSAKPIAVEYVLKLEVKVHGFFTNFVLNVPIIVQSREPYIEVSMEEEAPPPYDSVTKQ